MESERLAKLKRQKQLLLEHLDWISQEIDIEANQTVPSSTPKASRLVEAVDELKPIDESLTTSRIDVESVPQGNVVNELYSELGPDTKNAAADAKKGCLIVAVAAFGLFLAVCCYVLFFY